MKSIFARKTTLGHVMMQAKTTAHSELCFMGYLAKGRTLCPPSKRSSNL
jgi:hypothetical protein